MWGNHPEWWEGTKSLQPSQPTEHFKNYNPDMNPSASRIFTEVVKGRCVRVWEVHGVGVLCMAMEGDPQTGRLTGNGFSIFTKEEIDGHRPI